MAHRTHRKFYLLKALCANSSCNKQLSVSASSEESFLKIHASLASSSMSLSQPPVREQHFTPQCKDAKKKKKTDNKGEHINTATDNSEQNYIENK